MNKNVLHNIKKSPAIVLSDAKKIIDRCVDRLTDQKDPVMFCVKMQLFLEDQYKNKGKCICIVPRNKNICSKSTYPI